MTGLDEILAAEQVHSVYQPIVDLETDAVVAYEALARGPVGSLQQPDQLFAAATTAGRLTELDDLCQRAALTGAIDSGIFAPLTLFINVEPQVVHPARLERLLSIAHASPSRLELMLEITERALAVRPADLLATVRRLRAAGWRIALDDVGADDLSLAFMPLLRPDVIKLDMALVQRRPGPKAAEIMNAVNAFAERTGSVILAEGIETLDHLASARALGATLGQGWLFGRPAADQMTNRGTGQLRLPNRQPLPDGTSPFEGLPESITLRHSKKSLLIEVSKHLEREATRLGGTCLMVSTFQHARNFTPSTARRYRRMAERVGFVGVIGAELSVEPVPGVRGADLDPGDPVRNEWDIAVLSPHFAAALIARDLVPGSSGPDRSFEFALTYDRAVVEASARSLMLRVLPSPVAADPSHGAVDTGPGTGAGGPPRPAVNPVVGGPTDGAFATEPTDRQRLPLLSEADVLEAAVLEARMNDTGTAVVHLRLDTRHADHPDQIFRVALERLLVRLRRRDVVARHPDGVMIVLLDLDQLDAPYEAAEIAGQLVAALSMPAFPDVTGPLTATVGISSFPVDGDDIGHLLEAAESRSAVSLSDHR